MYASTHRVACEGLKGRKGKIKSKKIPPEITARLAPCVCLLALSVCVCVLPEGEAGSSDDIGQSETEFTVGWAYMPFPLNGETSSFLAPDNWTFFFRPVRGLFLPIYIHHNQLTALFRGQHEDFCG
jgi:hypothetical protein